MGSGSEIEECPKSSVSQLSAIRTGFEISLNAAASGRAFSGRSVGSDHNDDPDKADDGRCRGWPRRRGSHRRISAGFHNRVLPIRQRCRVALFWLSCGLNFRLSHDHRDFDRNHRQVVTVQNRIGRLVLAVARRCGFRCRGVCCCGRCNWIVIRGLIIFRRTRQVS